MAGLLPIHSVGKELGHHLGGALKRDGVTCGLSLFGHFCRSLIVQLQLPFEVNQFAGIHCKRKNRAIMCVAGQASSCSNVLSGFRHPFQTPSI